MAAVGAGSAAGLSGVAGLVEDKRGAWMFADGSLLPKTEFPELYAVIGGGCGTSPALFRLPDLMRRVVAVAVPVPWNGYDTVHHYLGGTTMEARVVREFNHLIKVRTGDDSIPVGTVLAYVGSELPDWA